MRVGKNGEMQDLGIARRHIIVAWLAGLRGRAERGALACLGRG